MKKEVWYLTDLVTPKVEENNIENNSRDRVRAIIQIIFMVTGLINITCANVLTKKLPFIIGLVTMITSIISLMKNIKEKEYKTLDTMKIPTNIVTIIISSIILFEQQNAIPFIAMVWGLSGLRKGIKGLNVAIFNKTHNKKFLLEFFHATIETTLSILLIFNPFEKIEEHLILLGIEMIISSLRIAFKDSDYENIEA